MVVVVLGSEFCLVHKTKRLSEAAACINMRTQFQSMRQTDKRANCIVQRGGNAHFRMEQPLAGIGKDWEYVGLRAVASLQRLSNLHCT